jgi:hypothetical protein
MIGPFLLFGALALGGALAGGIALAMRVAPYRGQTGPLRWQAWLAAFVTTILACLPALVVLLGLIDFESPATMGLLLAAGLATGLPLLIPADLLPRREVLILACLALAVILAGAALFAVSERVRDARYALHATCRDRIEGFEAERRCIAHVDRWLSLPPDLPP